MMRFLVVAMLLLCAARTDAAAAEFPTHAVKLVVPFGPGGSTDITARILAAKLYEKWGQAVIVENIGGGDTVLGTRAVVKAAPDGHTILVATSALPIGVAMHRTSPYDPLVDLLPVTLLSQIPNILVVHPSVPAKTIEEFVALARSRPGGLNFASPGQSTGQRLTFELLKQKLGIDVTMIPYKGGAAASQGILAGEVQSMIINVIEALPLIQSGQLRALAVTTGQRLPELPDVPTLAEKVLPNFDTTVWQALFVPAGTPADVVAVINRDVRAIMSTPEVSGKLGQMGQRVVTGTPEDLTKFLRSEIDLWKDVALKANLIQD